MKNEQLEIFPDRIGYREHIKSKPHITLDKWRIRPCNRDQANAILKEHHRHSGRVVGYKHAIKLVDEDEKVVGVGISGRPTARLLDDGLSLEITRVCLIDGVPKNACTALYARLCRAARELGFERMYSYTLMSEPGSSLKAAGFVFDGLVRPGKWNRPSRKRGVTRPAVQRKRWLRLLNK